MLFFFNIPVQTSCTLCCYNSLHYSRKALCYILECGYEAWCAVCISVYPKGIQWGWDAGYFHSFTANSSNHIFIVLNLCTGALSGRNMFGPLRPRFSQMRTRCLFWTGASAGLELDQLANLLRTGLLFHELALLELLSAKHSNNGRLHGLIFSFGLVRLDTTLALSFKWQAQF